MKPLISIIMPVYNNEALFPGAVESILTQGFRNYELIIVVEDNSTDDTSKIAHNYAAGDERIIVIHLKNKWIYESINIAMQEVRGEYVYILNSDDRLRPDALQVLAGIVNKYNPDVVWTVILVHECDENRNILSYDVNKLANTIEQDLYFSNINDVRRNFLLFYKIYVANNNLNLYRASIAGKHEYYTDYANADQLFNLSVAPHINSAYVCSVPVYDFFLYSNKQNTSTKYHPLAREMYDLHYTEFISTFHKLEILNEEAEHFIANKRYQEFIHEVNMYNAENCELSDEEKIRRLFTHSINELVYNCAVKISKIIDLESIVLFFCIRTFSLVPIAPDFDYYFIYEMLAAMYDNELTDEGRMIITKGIYHEKNPFRIGKYTYEKMVKL